MSDYPKYQISRFVDGSRDYQVVVRADDFDELLDAMKNMKTITEQISKKKSNGEGSPTAKCETCGNEMNYKEGYKDGKQWKGLFCPNSEKGKPGHKPVWL